MSSTVREAVNAVDELLKEDREEKEHDNQHPATAASAKNAAALKADMFPKAHPVVARAMDGMTEGLRDLEAKKSATDEGREQLEAQEESAMNRMMMGSKMKHLMQQRENAAKMQERKLRRLESESARIHQEHDKVVVRLHAVMDPRITAMEQRMQKRKAALSKAEENVKGWAALKDKYKAAALVKLEERDHDLSAWKKTEQALKEAELEEKEAKEAYDGTRKLASRDIEAYKYASTKYDSVLSKEEVSKQAAQSEEASVVKMQNIMKMEEKQLDASLAVGEERITRRMAKAKATRDQAVAALSETKEQFKEWQAEERLREEQAAKLKAGFDSAEKEFAKKRAEVLNNASTVAFHREAAMSDFNTDDWAWGQGEGSDDDVSVTS